MCTAAVSEVSVVRNNLAIEQCTDDKSHMNGKYLLFSTNILSNILLMVISMLICNTYR